MNVTKFYIMLICVICTGSVFAYNTSFKEKTDNWLPTENWLQTETWLQPASASGRPTIGTNETAAADPTVPLGNGMYLLLGLGLAYGCYVLKNNKLLK